MKLFSRMPVFRDILQLREELSQCQHELANLKKENTELSETLQSKLGSLEEEYHHSEKESQTRFELLNADIAEFRGEYQNQLEKRKDIDEELENKISLEHIKLLEYSRLVESDHSLNVQRDQNLEALSEKLDQSLERLTSDEYFDQCNLKSTSRPIVWGDRNRLHISSKSAVFTCLFNVNSGEITVGDYSFAGSGVSILAGSHDMELPGFLRRDAEITEGCDIVIGSGVWLGSNSTILGPAVIGDNAVIAAGAVVTPGTVVESNCVYGGVPAKKIKNLELIDCYEHVQNVHVQDALQRNNGVLCVEGWHEKEPLLIGERIYIVHKKNELEAIVLTNKSKVQIYVNNKAGVDKALYIKTSDRLKGSGQTEGGFSEQVLNPGIAFIEIETGANSMEDRWIILRSELENIEAYIAESFT